MHYKAYDHRMRNEVVRTGNPNLYTSRGVPRSTSLGWIRMGLKDAITCDTFELRNDELADRLTATEAELAASHTSPARTANTQKFSRSHVKKEVFAQAVAQDAWRKLQFIWLMK